MPTPDIIFVDLDGVLADFSKKVTQIAGRPPKEFHAQRLEGMMWKLLAGEPGGVYTDLEWMPEGKKLWSVINDLAKSYGSMVYILTGVPHGRPGVSWVDQKYIWCLRELGPEYQVIIKKPNVTKIRSALTYFDLEAIPEDETWLLIDDQEKNLRSWVAAGGAEIHLPEYSSGVDDFLEKWEELVD